MAINRIEVYDIIRVSYVQDVKTAKDNIDKILDTELVFAISESKLMIKSGGKLYSVPLVEV